MQIEPLGTRVLCQIIPPKNTTEGGLELPEGSQDTSPFKEAEIVEVGPAVTTLAKGERVLLNNLNPRSIIREAGGDRNVFYITTEDNIQARIKQSEE